MLVFGKDSISLSADDKFIQEVHDLEGLHNVVCEISGVGSHNYEFAVYKDGNKCAVKIDHEGMVFLIRGLTKYPRSPLATWVFENIYPIIVLFVILFVLFSFGGG